MGLLNDISPQGLALVFSNITGKRSHAPVFQFAAKQNFTNEDLAMLAQTFGNIVRQNPNADRLKRAKLFSKAILKKKRVRLRVGAR